ncbi:MAG: hypothetical protein D6719_09325 [Candidatus Dadabacteria bacterium]|nr:MAG: hypothetical protein D6719_09325 [Candidatus Dadabacteria bacterium]
MSKNLEPGISTASTNALDNSLEKLSVDRAAETVRKKKSSKETVTTHDIELTNTAIPNTVGIKRKAETSQNVAVGRKVSPQLAVEELLSTRGKSLSSVSLESHGAVSKARENYTPTVLDRLINFVADTLKAIERRVFPSRNELAKREAELKEAQEKAQANINGQEQDGSPAVWGKKKKRKGAGAVELETAIPEYQGPE